ncbi:expressed unknown protein [Seminavis robusta]|uniref:SAP domain-containing protein n=1 Tax=Seminavis robusta TaxID=568900 RepID=A0A9N8ELH3_9STRA|nr:expressed unknown protein [Seminavis robusta]|eukprot:Sro1197_g251530.1 n/a (271) ;mRNA; f:15705-16624
MKFLLWLSVICVVCCTASGAFSTIRIDNRSPSQRCLHPIIRQRRRRSSVVVLHDWGWGPGQSRPPALDNNINRQPPVVADDDIFVVEQQVRASAQARVDQASVTRAVEQVSPPVVSTWSISVAAGVAAGIACLVATQSLVLAGMATAGIAFVASRNPTEEDNPVGAIARMLGRKTLDTVVEVTPKAKALARVALSGQDELDQLRMEKEQLQTEVKQLRLWKARRTWIDERGPEYNLQQLKELARQNNLLVGGTKSQILMRLIEARIIRID